MTTTHDDLPHPVPPIAYLRYKENWFFLIIDVADSVFGMAHFSYEPGHEFARMSCNLMVQGEQYQYSNQIPFPTDFAMARQIGDENLVVNFVEAHSRIDMRLDSDDVDLNMSFLRYAPTFDFEAYEAANPEKPTLREVLNFASNQLFLHQQQAMTICGTLRLKSGKASGKAISLSGMGYRDHSRGMRRDNMNLRHVWSFLYFPSMVIGALSITSVLRAGISTNGGYVHDVSGTRSLRDIDIIQHGVGKEGLPGMVEFGLSDVYGSRYTVNADIAGRMGYVPLALEPAIATGYLYNVAENFCPITLKETGKKGYALVEIGFNTKK